MGANYLVQLAAEWYEFQGYLVRRNVPVDGGGSKGAVELDVVAIDAARSEIVHLEASMDTDSWQKRERRFGAKFKAGEAYCRRLARAMKGRTKRRQLALLVYGRASGRRSIGGGELVLMPGFLHEITEVLGQQKLQNQIVPEHLPLIRTLQFVTEYREDLFARDWLF